MRALSWVEITTYILCTNHWCVRYGNNGLLRSKRSGHAGTQSTKESLNDKWWSPSRAVSHWKWQIYFRRLEISNYKDYQGLYRCVMQTFHIGNLHGLHHFTIKSNKKSSHTEGTFFLPRSGTVATVSCSCEKMCCPGRPQANISEAQLLIKPPSPLPTSLVCGSNSNLAKQWDMRRLKSETQVDSYSRFEKA